METFVLTGGYACGKSSALKAFASLGVPTCDADAIGHKLLTEDDSLIQAICNTFGNHLLTREGHINRAELGAVVFHDAASRHQLESLIHPLILVAIECWQQTNQAPYGVVEIPLAVEKMSDLKIDGLVVVDISETLQRQRALQHRPLTEQRLAAILSAQSQRLARLRRADYVLDNTGDAEKLRQQIHFLHHWLMHKNSAPAGLSN